MVSEDEIPIEFEEPSPAVPDTKCYKRNQKEWKQNVRKKLCQSGKGNLTTSKKQIPSRTIKM